MFSKPFIKQAVILAGGLGTRMKPFTETLPKPLYPIHGKPFLGYLLEQLKGEGIERVLLLLGFKADAVRDYVGTGGRFGLDVSCSISPAEAETGTRLRLAASAIDPLFLLLYCDNYWPMSLGKMSEQFEKMKTAVQVTCYQNDDGYTKDNLRLDEEGRVLMYDKERKEAGLRGVDIGYMLVRREVLRRLPEENSSFERAVLAPLASEGQLGAYRTGHRYYSIGSPQRLPLTEAFFAEKRAILLDRDGVLNEKAPEGHYIYCWKHFKWLPGAREAVALLKKAGYIVCLASNQAGIGRGLMGEHDLHAIHENMQNDLRAAGGFIDKIYTCPHHWEDDCACRKPKPGMLFQAQRDFHLDLTKTFFVGDDPRDGMAAEAADIPFIPVTPEQSLLDVVRRLS